MAKFIGTTLSLFLAIVYFCEAFGSLEMDAALMDEDELADPQTECSPKAGEKCVFPYTKGGKTCAGPKCCNLDNDPKGAWCSTKTDASGNHISGNYAYCAGSSCDPDEGKTEKKDIEKDSENRVENCGVRYFNTKVVSRKMEMKLKSAKECGASCGVNWACKFWSFEEYKYKRMCYHFNQLPTMVYGKKGCGADESMVAKCPSTHPYVVDFGRHCCASSMSRRWCEGKRKPIKLNFWNEAECCYDRKRCSKTACKPY